MCILGPDVIRSQAGGYQIVVDRCRLDVARFDDLVAAARRAEDPEAEAGLLAEALALWRGPALSDVTSEVLHRDDVPALTERRLRALSRRIELDLAAGRAAGRIQVPVPPQPAVGRDAVQHATRRARDAGQRVPAVADNLPRAAADPAACAVERVGIPEPDELAVEPYKVDGAVEGVDVDRLSSCLNAVSV